MKSRIIFLISILCLILACPVFANETATISVSQDSVMNSTNPNTNYNGSWLYIRSGYKAYIQFDVSQYAGTVLGIDNFQFNFNGAYPRPASVYLITGEGADDWNETTITWNNAPGNDTASSAFFLNNAVFTSTLIGSVVQPALAGISTVGFVWDSEAAKTAVINQLNTGDRKVTMGISRNSTSQFAQYACKEQAPTYHPIRMDMTFDTLALVGTKMIAQPESREVYFGGEVVDTAATDPETARIGYCSATDVLWDGNLILAFKLPALPAGKVISSASLSWLYLGHGSRTGPTHDLYGLNYRPAATSPLITAADFYVGTSDAAATKIGANVTDFNAVGQWLGTDAQSKLLAAYIQAQYANGAAQNDWILLRINPIATMNLYVLHTIKGPNAADPASRPFIEFEFADVSEGYWKAVNASPVHIDPNGINTSQANYYVGSTTVNNSQQTIDLLVPFAFPQLAAGEYAGEVSFVSKISGPYQFPGRYFPIDIYGLAYRSGTAFQASDYWLGPYSVLPAEGLNGTPIASKITEGMSVQPATWVLSEEGSQRAANYINAQKAAGATASSYGFFRLNPRYNALYYTRQMFSYPEMAVRVTTAAPAVLPTPETEYACPIIGYTDYPVADEDGDCQVTLADLNIMLSRWLECFAEPASYYCP